MRDYDIAPLLDDSTCPVLGVSANIFEIIFRNLSLLDLSRLSQCSKSFNDQVGEFLRHECLSHKIGPDQIKEFLKNNGRLLTSVESELFNKSEVVSYLNQDEGLSHRKLLYKLLYLDQREQLNLNVKRVSIADDKVFFPHRGDEQYVPIRYCDPLDRNIVMVESVCWLEFRYTFKDVAPGKYSISFRMRIEENFLWPHLDDEPSEICLVTTDGSSQWWMYNHWWLQLADGDTPPEDDDWYVFVTWEQVGSDITPWITVTLPEFETEEIGDIKFQFEDVVSDDWKGGVSFDFIELKTLALNSDKSK